MKVGYFINQYPQPSQTFIRREIRMLEAQGWTVHRYTARHTLTQLADPNDIEEQRKTRPILGCGKLTLIKSTLRTLFTRPGRFFDALRLTHTVSRPSGKSLFLHLIYLAEACVLLEWTRQDDVKHVHAHFGTNSTTVVMLLHALGGPTYSFTSHGPEEYDMPIAISIGEKIRRSAFTVGITSFGRSQLLRWIDYHTWDKVKIVRCGVDFDFLHEPAVPLPREPRLVNIGRLSPAKGQSLLVKAAAILKRQGVSFQLDIIGGGELRPALEALIRDLDVADRVHLLGFQSGAQVRQKLDESRIMVMPSFAEGLPVVIMEALARRRAVISTAIAGIPDLVKPGRTGWLIPPGDESALAAAMKEAIEASDEQLNLMGEAGAALVHANHDASKEAAKLADYFRPLVSDKRGNDVRDRGDCRTS